MITIANLLNLNLCLKKNAALIIYDNINTWTLHPSSADELGSRFSPLTQDLDKYENFEITNNLLIHLKTLFEITNNLLIHLKILFEITNNLLIHLNYFTDGISFFPGFMMKCKNHSFIFHPSTRNTALLLK